MIGRTISHYEIVEKLGEGGMGVVYKARDTHLRRHVAIKLLPPERVADADRKRRFIQEARSASSLNHPHIVTVHDIDQVDGIDFIAMEFVEGETLEQLIGRKGLSLNETLKYGEQVADALDKAHSAGIVHRDLKPANVMVTEDGRAKVLDFGLAKLGKAGAVSADESTLTAQQPTESGVVVGTAGYMSPEQVEGGNVDSRSDIFSLGAMLYEMLTGRRAFKGDNPTLTLAAVLYKQPPPLGPDIPEGVEELVQRCLQKEPDRRLQSMADLKRALQELRKESESGGSSGISAARRILTPLAPRKRRARWSVAAACVAAVAIAAVLWQLPRLTTDEPPAEALRWYREGVNAFRDGAYYKATQLLERATAADPAFVLANARLAEAWNALDYSDRAREAMLRASPPGRPTARLSESDALQLQAIHAVLTNNHAAAVARYRELARRATASEAPAVLVDLGRALERADNYQEALANYTEAARRRPDLASAHLLAGSVLRRLRRIPDAEAELSQAESLYRALSNLEGVTEVMYRRSVLLNQLGRLSEARTLLEQGLGLAQAGGNAYQRVVILVQLSSVDYAEGRAADGQQHAAEALRLARASGFENLTARALLEVGGNAHVRGELNEAESNYLQALEIARRFRGRYSEMRALVSLGSVRLNLGKQGDAVRDLETPLAWYNQNGFRKEAGTTRILLARAKRFGGDYAGSAAALEEQRDEAHRAGDDDNLVLALGELGSVWIEQERYPEALAKFREAYALAAARGNKLRMRWEAAQLADALWRVGRFADARKSLTEAAALAEAGKDKALLAWLNRIRAEMSLSEGRLSEAAALASRSEAAEEDKTEAADAVRIAALAELGAGRRAQAKALIVRAANLSGENETARRRLDRLLALSAVLLQNGDSAGALVCARQAREIAARSGQRESEWRAVSLAARAGDPGLAAEIPAALNRLWEALGSDRPGFMARPDVRLALKTSGLPDRH